MSASSLRSFEYLEGLPGTTFNRLYKQPSTALAIFRRMLTHLGTQKSSSNNLETRLTELAKSFVMALLYISHPLPVTDLESWVRPDGKRYATEKGGTGRSDIVRGRETLRSTSSKGYIFYPPYPTQANHEHTASPTPSPHPSGKH